MNYLVDSVLHYCNISVSKSSKINEREIDYYDFTFVLDGNMVYTENGKTIHLKKNDAVFFKPGTLRGREARNTPVSYVSFNFTAKSGVEFPFESYLENCITSDIKKLVSVYPLSHLAQTFHSVEKCSNMLNYILFEMLDFAKFKCGNDHVLKILKYIDENITERITLETVAHHINLSKEYTSGMFAKEMGKTLTEYINEKKLLFAKELILSEKMSLAQIAEHLGFENYNYFSRLFKKYFGTTAAYLKKKRL